MEEILNRFITDLLERPSGPLSMRFLLQPVVAIFFGLRAGMSDAKLRREPYFRTVILEKDQRAGLAAEGWKDIGKLVIMACLLDTVFQLIVQRWIYPLETVVIAVLLAVFPYVAARGLASRMFRWVREDTAT